MMRIAIITVFLAITAFSFLLKYLNYSRRNAPIPENVKDVYDEDAYKKYQAYSMDRTVFSIISGSAGAIITLLFLLFNVHHRLFEFITAYVSSTVLAGLFVLFVPLLIESVIGSLLGIYDTFVIEEKHGFNKTKPATYIGDFFKSLAVGAVIGGGLLALFYVLYGRMGDMVFIAFFFVLLVFMALAAFLSPLFIRIFNKLTPLEDGELKDKIVALADKTGCKLKGIYTVDASRRSTKSNAFAAGFGRTKTIGLYDTLLDKFTDDEIISILAHEIGHEKKRHTLKSLPLSLLSSSVILAVAYFVVTRPEVSMAFGFAEANIAFGVYALFILVAPLALLLSIPSNALSRKFEFEADEFEKEHAGSESSVSAMKKLYRENLSNLTPHPFVVMMNHSHPTAAQRIAALEE